MGTLTLPKKNPPAGGTATPGDANGELLESPPDGGPVPADLENLAREAEGLPEEGAAPAAPPAQEPSQADQIAGILCTLYATGSIKFPSLAPMAEPSKCKAVAAALAPMFADLGWVIPAGGKAGIYMVGLGALFSVGIDTRNAIINDLKAERAKAPPKATPTPADTLTASLMPGAAVVPPVGDTGTVKVDQTNAEAPPVMTHAAMALYPGAAG